MTCLLYWAFVKAWNYVQLICILELPVYINGLLERVVLYTYNMYQWRKQGIGDW